MSISASSRDASLNALRTIFVISERRESIGFAMVASLISPANVAGSSSIATFGIKQSGFYQILGRRRAAPIVREILPEVFVAQQDA